MLHVTKLMYISGKRLWVLFDDGASGEIDLEGKLSGPVFESLKDDSKFSELYLDEESETVSWPNGADLAPEFLKQVMIEQAAAVQQMQG